MISRKERKAINEMKQKLSKEPNSKGVTVYGFGAIIHFKTELEAQEHIEHLRSKL